MVNVFPTGLFGFLQQEIDIERQTLRGPSALNGEQDIISADGGGRVFAEFGNGSLVDRERVLAWRAVLGQLEDGVARVIVPFCDPRHQPYGGAHAVPHDDGTPFDDGALYVGGGAEAEAAEAAALRATTLKLNILFPRPLLGGEWFAIQHPNKDWRAYRVVQVVEQDSETATVTFRPPLREAVDAGEFVDFASPRCLMVQDGKAAGAMQYRRHVEAAIRFIEAP